MVHHTNFDNLSLLANHNDSLLTNVNIITAYDSSALSDISSGCGNGCGTSDEARMKGQNVVMNI